VGVSAIAGVSGGICEEAIAAPTVLINSRRVGGIFAFCKTGFSLLGFVSRAKKKQAEAFST
jgi:hypothetical protein